MAAEYQSICHCGKDGHALNSVNCPVHGRETTAKRPVAFRVPRSDPATRGQTLSATEWRLFSEEEEAYKEASAIGADYQGLYVRDGSAWRCAARKQGSPGGNTADCDWPGCGCDPYANRVLIAIDEAGFEITKKRAPLAWDANSNYHYEPVEALAAEIYGSFAYDGPGEKPAWTPAGNGLKQDEARFEARRRLRDVGHVPAQLSDLNCSQANAVW